MAKETWGVHQIDNGGQQRQSSIPAGGTACGAQAEPCDEADANADAVCIGRQRISDGDASHVAVAAKYTGVGTGSVQLWPHDLSHLAVLRGQMFYADIQDPLDWHRTGTYQYLTVGWDAGAGLYEAWEPSGLHTRKFTETEVLNRLRNGGSADSSISAQCVAWWADDELPGVPELEIGTSQACADDRDKVMSPQHAGWKPYGTLEMAGPMLFHLAAQRDRNPSRFQSVCDVGAGTGRMSAWLNTAWGFDVTALDIALPNWPEYEVQQFDGRHIPLPDKSVDIVVFAFVLHHCRHFEIQRALLNEAARIARQSICIAEDTPANERDQKAARGHDHLGHFQSVPAWRATFRSLQLRLVHEGPLWTGPKHKPSPYRCTRRYFMLEVPQWLCPAKTAENLPGLSRCCTANCGLKGQPTAEPKTSTSLVAESRALAQIATSSNSAVADIRDQWLIFDLPVDSDGPFLALSTSVCTLNLVEGATQLPSHKVLRFNSIPSFTSLQLPLPIRTALSSQGFSTPTPIQSAAIPVALMGLDMVAVAATGSGKTLAYLLPSLLRVLSAGAPREPFVLVLCPTRELARQIAACAEALLLPAASSPVGVGNDIGRVTAAAVWGGGSRSEQKKRLDSGASIIAATPGRLLDLVCELEEQYHYLLATVGVLVLDEGDRMLEEGLGDQIDALARRTAPMRQTLFFSATWPDTVTAIACSLCQSPPVLLRMDSTVAGGSASVNSNIRQRVEVFNKKGEDEQERDERKRARLLELLEAALGPITARQGDSSAHMRTAALPSVDAQTKAKALVFCMTKKFADSLVEHLKCAGWPAVALHGNKPQRERLWNLRRFAEGTSRVLVSTDVLGRGLDIPLVTHVFVYDFPSSVEEYVHRIGRTGRGTNEHGETVTFFEYIPSLPTLAGELIAYLTSAGQLVPEELQQMAAEAEAGVRHQRDCVAERHNSAVRGEKSKESLPLALPEELGDGWNAGGQRSWLFCEGCVGKHMGDPTGWLVFCQGGQLQTCDGLGKWRINSAGDMVVEFGGSSTGADTGRPCRVYELQLHHWWEGRRREHFSSIAASNRDEECKFQVLTGWVTRSKVYRYHQQEVPA